MYRCVGYAVHDDDGIDVSPARSPLLQINDGNGRRGAAVNIKTDKALDKALEANVIQQEEKRGSNLAVDEEYLGET